MMNLKQLKLGSKLVGGSCLLLLLICGGMGLLSYRAASHALQNSIELSLPSMAKESAKYVRVRLDNYLLGIEGVANRLVIKSMDWKKQRPALENETKRLGYLGMGIVAPDGLAQYPDGSTAQLGDRQYVKDAFAGKTAISDVVISRITNQPVIMLATPIRSESDKIAAVLIARLDGSLLSEITDQIKYGVRGYSYIINKEGALVAHNNREFVLKARNFLEEGKTNSEFRRLSEMMVDCHRRHK